MQVASQPEGTGQLAGLETLDVAEGAAIVFVGKHLKSKAQSIACGSPGRGVGQLAEQMKMERLNRPGPFAMLLFWLGGLNGPTEAPPSFSQRSIERPYSFRARLPNGLRGNSRWLETQRSIEKLATARDV